MSLTRDSSGALHLGGALLQNVIDEVGTPTYVYDLDGMAQRARALDAAFDATPHLVAYAVKANTAGAVVRALADAGCGADVVSGAELAVALACGIAPDRIVYSGVAKTDDELDRAIACGARGIGAIQVESLEEIARVGVRAKVAGRRARVGIRINPSIDLADATHAHIQTGHDEAKFGVPLDDVARAVALAEGAPHLELVGMAVHAGSQLKHVAPYLGAARVLFDKVRELRKSGVLRALAYVDAGGGFGVDYGEGAAVDPVDFVRAARAELHLRGLDDLALYIEPGRSLVAASGVLLARVIQAKVATAARWLMIDAGMNDLVRPALYQARHRIVPLDSESVKGEAVAWHVVGPVCESSDDFGEHLLPRYPPRAVAILDAGAYGYTMASRYNGRQIPVEVFVRGGSLVGKTKRATLESWALERANAGVVQPDDEDRATILEV
ncbi:MAG TPA: diaminopimelate decarboxylase [Polyangiaceae bacterium]|jgi:diaminopimelate decarboxylase